MNLSASGFWHCFSCYMMPAGTHTLLTFYFTTLGIHMLSASGCKMAAAAPDIIPILFPIISLVSENKDSAMLFPCFLLANFYLGLID